MKIHLAAFALAKPQRWLLWSQQELHDTFQQIIQKPDLNKESWVKLGKKIFEEGNPPPLIFKATTNLLL